MAEDTELDVAVHMAVGTAVTGDSVEDIEEGTVVDVVVMDVLTADSYLKNSNMLIF